MEIFPDDCVRTVFSWWPLVQAGFDAAFHRYPLVFAVITLPLSVVRWRSGFGSNIRHFPTATFAVEFIYSLSGALNVLLFLYTRSDLFLPRNRLGVAPKPTLAGGQADHTDTTNSKVEASPRSDAHQPLPAVLLPGADDKGWRLPTSEHDTNELV
jgi:hypothetical protein